MTTGIVAGALLFALGVGCSDDDDKKPDGSVDMGSVDRGVDVTTTDGTAGDTTAGDTTAGDTMAGDTSTSDSGGDASASAVACALYCDNVEANCTGGNQIYPNRGACEAACAAMSVGQPSDTSGDSVYCRAHHGGALAASDPATHCPHAGISSSGGVCGSACDAYCDQAMAHCGGANELYADRAACTTACAAFNASGDWNASAGDSVQCRAYHASFPAAADPALHCPHAAADGGGVCVN